MDQGYLLIVYLTMIIVLFMGVLSIRYAKDILHKVICEEVFYHFLTVNDRKMDWYCVVNEKETVPICFPGGILGLGQYAEFDTKEVWFNTQTKRAYKATSSDLIGKITIRLTICMSIMLFFILFSIRSIFIRLARPLCSLYMLIKSLVTFLIGVVAMLIIAWYFIIDDKFLNIYVFSGLVLVPIIICMMIYIIMHPKNNSLA